MDSPQPNTSERWRGLCKLAISEHDPEKFRAILQELNHLLNERDQKERRGSA